MSNGPQPALRALLRHRGLLLSLALAGALSAMLPFVADPTPGRAASTISVNMGQSIQDAINAASPGDTIEVAPGTYAGGLTINKSLTLKGSGRDQTTITGQVNITADRVTFTGFTVKNSPTYGIYPQGSDITISNNIVEDNGTGIYWNLGTNKTGKGLQILNNTVRRNGTSSGGAGIMLTCGGTKTEMQGNTEWVISGNQVLDNYGAGIDVECTTGAQVTNNQVSGTKSQPQGSWNGSEASLSVSFSDRATVSGNTVSSGYRIGISLWNTQNSTVRGNTVSGTSGSMGAGVFVGGDGTSGFAATNNIITQNVLTGNTVGLKQWATAASLVTGTAANHNKIESNTTAGLVNDLTEPSASIDATENWWGSQNGPRHQSNTFNVASQGATVSDNVKFVPWWSSVSGSAGLLSGTSFAPVTTSGGNKYASIQAAVDAASPDETVSAAAGTYSVDQLLINKSLTLQGAGAASTILDGGNKTIAKAGTIRIADVTSGTGVTVKGFTIKNFGATSGDVIGLTARGCSVPVVIDSNHFIGNGKQGDFDVGVWVYHSLPGGTATVSNNEFNGMWNGVMLERPLGGAGVMHNTFHDLHLYSSGGTAIEPRAAYALAYDGENVSSPVVIQDNTMSRFAGAGVTILGTYSESDKPAKFADVTIKDNTIACIGSGSEPRHVGIRLYNGANTADQALSGGVDKATISGNMITGAGDAGSYGVWLIGPNRNVSITGNSISAVGKGVAAESKQGSTAGAATSVHATNNWWGSQTGPKHPSNPGGTGVLVSDNITFSPWLGSGVDADAATPGFQSPGAPRYGIPTRLVFTTQPGGAEEGKALSPQPVVQAQDAQGNLGINFAGAVTLSIGSNPSGGTLSGTATQTASGGIVAFGGLSISKAGIGYTLVANASGLQSATSATFNISSPPSGGDGGGGGGGGAAATPPPQPTAVPPAPTPEVVAPTPTGLPPQVGAPSTSPAAAPMVTTTVPAGGGAAVATDNPSVSVSVPAGGAGQPVVASYQSLAQGAVPPPQGALRLGGTVFQLEFRDPATQAKVPTTAQLTINYTDADVALAGGAAALGVAVFDGTNWVPLPSTVDTVGRTVTATTVIDATFALVAAPSLAAGQAMDYAVENGWFFSQANGLGGAGSVGYTVTDADGIPFWTEFQRLGGVPVVGYPVTQRFVYGGFVTQAFQKMVFQWRPESNSVAFVNVFDELSRAGRDGWLMITRQTPEAFDTSPDTGLSFEEVMARHLEMLKQDPAIEAFFLGTQDWLNRYGLPVSYADLGNLSVVRAQRAVLQRWKVDAPWAAAGEITVANGGDLGKEAGLWPLAATAPVPVAATPTR